MHTLQLWLGELQTAWFSPRCPICAAAIDARQGLCAGCTAELPTLASPCRHCALPVPPASSGHVCPNCLRRPAFDHALAAFPYEEPIAWLITGLKYRNHPPYARILGDLLAGRIVSTEADSGRSAPDILAPVPLHPAAFRRRGFNQAQRIAARLQRRLGWTLDPELFQRTRDTPRQSTLGAAARARNVHNAFATRHDLSGLHIALVDDVVTTTRTAAALAACARQAGARAVDVYCVARAC